MSDRTAFSARAADGKLAGWVSGDGPPVLLLHGGPGVRQDYMEPVAEELRNDYRVAIFQQRGVAPSTLEGPFTIAQAISDVLSVLDELEWQRALLVGHSWGGHLAFRVTAVHPGQPGPAVRRSPSWRMMTSRSDWMVYVSSSTTSGRFRTPG